MTNALCSKLDIRVPVGSLDSYLSAINRIPILSEKEEQTLASQYQSNNDLNAAKQLVLPHLRFVARIAKGYMGYGLPLADLIQEGNIGLMKAVKRFNPAVGVRLVSFAVHWIKAEIHQFVLRNWRIVRIATTKEQQKLFFRLRSAKKRLGLFTQDEIKSVAEDLGVKPETVMEMEERMNNSHDITIENHSEDDDQHLSPIHYLEDHRYAPEKQLENQENEERDQQVHHALAVLDERSRDILQQRWLDNEKATLHDLAQKYAVSIERIRQLEQNAMKKLKATLLPPIST